VSTDSKRSVAIRVVRRRNAARADL
jgi:hypothetical protein